MHQVNINLMNHTLLKWTGNSRLLVFMLLLVISWLMAEFFAWQPVKKFITKTIWSKLSLD